MENNSRESFKGTFGFIMAAAGSAVGLGNIWRFPYLAARDGGGLFLLCYIVLALTFGYTLLTTEIALGRKTAQGPLTAYGAVNKKWGFIGILASIVPAIILPYYCAIGGWVIKYAVDFLTGAAAATAEDGYFTGFITSDVGPIVYMAVFSAAVAFVVFSGVEKGIEKYSKILMPVLFVMIIGIAVFSLTLKAEDASGQIRSGLEGLSVFVIPDFTGLTFGHLLSVIRDALGQLFYSISVAMGIMVAYGSYSRKDTDLMKSINSIEIFDTLVAFVAGVMIIPAVYVFMGMEGMSAGPGLMFISLPKIFKAMGSVGVVIGAIFFVMVLFAAVTSAISISEAIVASLMDKFKMSRNKAAIATTVYGLILGIVVCLGYNVLYFDYTLPNGAVGQILDIMDYVSNNVMMPIVAICTCILFGWVAGPDYIISEVESGGVKFGRKKLFIVMIKYVAPVLLALLLLQGIGIIG
ncbi:MAG: sodium-dependent transporter [Eubacteriales bacterium]|nr:sodium-dependent transporter [Eubacteriales bacterium]